MKHVPVDRTLAAAAHDDGAFTSRFVSAGDGLKLHLRDYDVRPFAGRPVVCLPGLTRNAADFHELAVALSSSRRSPRRVLALDYRGRGRSEWDRNWRNYDVRTETQDTLQVMAALGIEEAIFVGTSRGGLIAMVLAAVRPALVRGVVFNDVGPVIDARGLLRIRSYVGQMPRPADWREGSMILKRLMGAQFPKLTESEWETLARRTWVKGRRGLRPAYDPSLMKTLEAIDFEAPLPHLWSQYGALQRVPVLTLRAANSDILSEKTLAEMSRRHPNFDALTVPDQGHAPLLSGKDLIQRIARFLDKVDRQEKAAAEAPGAKR